MGSLGTQTRQDPGPPVTPFPGFSPSRSGGSTVRAGVGWPRVPGEGTAGRALGRETAALEDGTETGCGGGSRGHSAPFPQPQAGDTVPAPPPVRRRSSANYRAYATEPHAKVRSGASEGAGPVGGARRVWIEVLRAPASWGGGGSSVYGIFQARVLEWGAIAQHILIQSSLVWLLATY